MRRKGFSCGWFLLLVLSYSAVAGQSPTVDDSTNTPPDTSRAALTTPAHPAFRNVNDTVSMENMTYFEPSGIVPVGAQVTNPRDHESRLTQKPTAALFKSMLIPGWGQIGNRQYLKAGIVVAFEGWLISSAIRIGNETTDRLNEYQAAVDQNLPEYDRNVLYASYQEKRSQRNKYRWFSGLVIFISMFDAYVDAHMSGMPDNNRNSKVDFDIRPDERGGAEASLSLYF